MSASNANTSLRLPAEVLAAVDARAETEGKSRSAWLRDTVTAAAGPLNNLSPAKKSGRGDGVDTRRRVGEEPAVSTAVRNDVGPARDARAAGATDLGERGHPAPTTSLRPPTEGFETTPFERGNGCRHPRWRRLAGTCLRCGGSVR